MTTPSLLADGFGGYLVLASVAFLAHEPWRWLGLGLGSRLRLDSPIFIWVKYVATALVAALVLRLMIFPSGAFAKAGPELRLGVFGLAIVVFFLTGRKSLALSVGIPSLAFLLGAILTLPN
jgi:branched-subunit amino acid transport protein